MPSFSTRGPKAWKACIVYSLLTWLIIRPVVPAGAERLSRVPPVTLGGTRLLTRRQTPPTPSSFWLNCHRHGQVMDWAYPHMGFPREGMSTWTLALLPSPWDRLDSFDPLSTLLGRGRLKVIMNFVRCDDLKKVLLITLLAWVGAGGRKWNKVWVPETQQSAPSQRHGRPGSPCPKGNLHSYPLPKDTFCICKDSHVVWALRNTCNTQGETFSFIICK